MQMLTALFFGAILVGWSYPAWSQQQHSHSAPPHLGYMLGGVAKFVDDFRFVGPFPDELQNYTGVTAGIPTGAQQSEAVAAFISFLKSPTAIAAFKAKGMQAD
jgi:ABC-type molybdate transport system substrate-binding protein